MGSFCGEEMPEEMRVEKEKILRPEAMPVSMSETVPESRRTRLVREGRREASLDAASEEILSDVQKIVLSSH